MAGSDSLPPDAPPLDPARARYLKYTGRQVSLRDGSLMGEPPPAAAPDPTAPPTVLDLDDAELAELDSIQKSVDILKVAKAETRELEREREQQRVEREEATRRYRFLEEIQAKVLDEFSRRPENLQLLRLDPAARRSAVDDQISGLFDAHLERQRRVVPRPFLEKFIREVVDGIVGFGPLQPLIDDPTISEIMVNQPDQVFIERGGRLELTEIRFKGEAGVQAVAQKIVSLIGRKLDVSTPHVDARLPDGSRVHCIMPPVALDGTVITIRKFKAEQILIEDMVNWGTLTPAMAFFLGACVKARLNIIVSGGTGSGKTTTLNMLASLIPPGERIITVEDAAELKVRENHTHVIRLETRGPNVEGKGAITIRDLIRDCLRMRPDRIIVGEVRGGEALDMLQAMNTGHEGSFTTLHANAPAEALDRLETMCTMAGTDLPAATIRKTIGTSVDLIIQQKRYSDGSRRLSHITELRTQPGGELLLNDIFAFDQQGLDANGKVRGKYRCSGVRPEFIGKFKAHDLSFPEEALVSEPD